MGEYLHANITREILGAAFEVHNVLGPGFLEGIYEAALAQELSRRGLSFERQLDVPIHYKGELVGSHRLDFLVEGSVVVELKSVKALEDIHTTIVVSYLAATKLSVGLLVNFSTPSLQYKRVAL